MKFKVGDSFKTLKDFNLFGVDVHVGDFVEIIEDLTPSHKHIMTNAYYRCTINGIELNLIDDWLNAAINDGNLELISGHASTTKKISKVGKVFKLDLKKVIEVLKYKEPKFAYTKDKVHDLVRMLKTGVTQFEVIREQVDDTLVNSVTFSPKYSDEEFTTPEHTLEKIIKED